MDSFFNRELSWIEFNARVLYQALNKELPLMERLQFLSIVTSNFDEFFQVRVAGLKRLLMTDNDKEDISGLTPSLIKAQVSSRVHQIVRSQHDALNNDILPEFTKKNIEHVSPQYFTSIQTEYASSYFRSQIYPLLTPLRTDGEIFPNIVNLARYVAFLLVPISGIHNANRTLSGEDQELRISLVQIPSNLPSIIWLPGNDDKKQFTLLDEVIADFGTHLFSGFEVQETLLFKVARDADFAVDEESGSDFINEMEKVLVQRKSSFPVCITCNNTSSTIKNFLKDTLELTEEDVYLVNDNIIDPNSLMSLREIEESKNLSYPDWQHFYPSEFPQDEYYWDTLKERDLILHVPYETYEPVIKFINDAADDKDVLAIKMTLYRTGKDSPIVSALERAARNGKQVVVLVELKARFDEERNIAWAKRLENAGVTVIYGLVNLKVHAKILLVMRRENDSIRRYVHLSTGNYNPKTAKLYSDLSLFTSNHDVTNDATLFFNLVTGYSTLQNMKTLGMAPVNIKTRIINMIQREIDRSDPEHPGLIMAKMNSLTHEEVIEALYRASQAGVKILLNIRGICMLTPGVKGLSENIKVISIVDRYLEHSRIVYFQNGGSEEMYLSSADWMSRNLDRRIELLFPILDRATFTEVKDILDIYFKDNTSAHVLDSSGNWYPVIRSKNESKVRSQEELYKKYKRRYETLNKTVKIDFEVRRKD